MAEPSPSASPFRSAGAAAGNSSSHPTARPISGRHPADGSTTPWSQGDRPGAPWRQLLENGKDATIAEIAAAEKISESYVGRVLRLTLLAPDIVEAILGGRQPAEMTLALLMRPFSVRWKEQAEEFLQPS
jgi:hypothetical protein